MSNDRDLRTKLELREAPQRALLVFLALALGSVGDLGVCAWISMPAFWASLLSGFTYVGILLAAATFGTTIGLGVAIVAGILHVTVGFAACALPISQQGEVAVYAVVGLLTGLIVTPGRLSAPAAETRGTEVPRQDRVSRGALSPRLLREVRTPLSAIESAGYALEELAADENQRELVGIILKECRRVDVLIQSLEPAQPWPPMYREVDLSSMLDEVMRLSKAITIQSPFTLRKRFEPGIRVICDPELIEQAVLNLLTNGIRVLEPNDEVVLSAHSAGDGILIELSHRRVGILGQVQITTAPAPLAPFPVRSFDRDTRNA